MAHLTGRKSLPVLTYLVLIFGASVLALGGLVATTTVASFSSERNRVVSTLRSGAELAAATLSDEEDQTMAFLGPMASQPAARALDPSGCEAVFAGLGSLIGGFGHMHLLGADGKAICSLPPAGYAGDMPTLDWAAVLSGHGAGAVGAPVADPLTGKMSRVLVVPVHGDGGRTGYLLLVIHLTAAWSGIDVPASLPKDTLLVTLDGSRAVVVGSSDAGRDLTGRPTDGTGLVLPGSDRGRMINWFDGRRRFALEVSVPETDQKLVVAVPSGALTAGANEQLRRNLVVGAVASLLLAGLGLLLHQRLARPMRRITSAIREAGSGHDEVWAPAEGPAELGEMADAFNDMLAERRSREADLRHRATHDVLTGMLNRAALAEALTDCLTSGSPAAVLFMDLDRFKLVNDTHGHAVGDALLIALGQRLLAVVRPQDTVARFGGDEFVILCPGVVEEEVALQIAHRMSDALADVFLVEGHELFLTGSVGVAIGRPSDGPEDLLRDADNAMYRAKEQGRPGYAFFDAGMRDRSRRRLELEQELHFALERDELRLVYQPVFDTETGDVIGAEALLRWDSPQGPISPAEFIPIAEETGLVMPIGDWVLRTACRQAAAWRRELGRGLPVSVNIAARQLTRPGLATQVLVALGEAGANPDDLVLEITEHGVLEDFAAAFRHLQEVRALGVRVAVDDFGTGWSSLSYLQRLPVDELKIDRSFVATLGVEGPSMAIVGALVSLAHGLGLTVVAEGVETDEQLAELRRLGCDSVQGFLLARPAPPEEIPLRFGTKVPIPADRPGR
ncbi:MAG TPA: EAL domain-containing protein [Acidimicrobiia bacterium]|nr:EAL domain-containing protein [Acidimicrobiia bacterium]